MKLSHKGYMTLFITFLLILSGCSAFPEEEELAPPIVVPKEVSYTTRAVEKGYIESAINVVATVTPADIQYVYVTDHGSRLEEYVVGLGDKVNEGDNLLKLLTDDLEKNIEIQTLNVQGIENDIYTTRSVFDIEWENEEEKLESLTDPDAIDFQEDMMDIKKLYYNNSMLQKNNNLAIQKMNLEEMERIFEDAFLKAPITGTVIFMENLEEGDYLGQYDKLIGVADESYLHIIYSGNDASQFYAGNEVVITYRNSEYEGTVTMSAQSAPEEDKEKYKNIVVFGFDNETANLTRGNNVSIKLIKESKEDAIIVPKSLVHKYGDDKIVYVLVDGLREERYVVTGIESGTYVEIVEGLAEGEMVITN